MRRSLQLLALLLTGVASVATSPPITQEEPRELPPFHSFDLSTRPWAVYRVRPLSTGDAATVQVRLPLVAAGGRGQAQLFLTSAPPTAKELEELRKPGTPVAQPVGLNLSLTLTAEPLFLSLVRQGDVLVVLEGQLQVVGCSQGCPEILFEDITRQVR